MSTFFKALEQAELDRKLGEQARSPEPAGEAPVETPAPVAAAEAAAPVAVRPAPAAPPPAAAPEARPAEALRRAAEPAPARPRAAGARIAAEAERPWGELDEQLVSLLQPASPEAEQYRGLRHTVEHLARTERRCVLAVSSPAAGDGKTLTAINLAGALGQAPDARVLLIDADLRRSALAERLGLGASGVPGLVDAILDPALTLDQVVRRRAPYNISVLPAGTQPSAPYEVLKSPRLGELLDVARQRFDYVILDTPPITTVPDCRVIGKWVDGIVVVVAADRTPRKLLEEALDLMEPSKVVGLVFNQDARPRGHDYAREARAASRLRRVAL